MLHNAEPSGNCPKTSRKLILSDVARKSGDWRYSVVSNTNTTIVNVALSRNGDFHAWDNARVVLTARDVQDYSMHQKYGVSGAPFSTYVLFALNDAGFVLKVKGQDPGSSKWDTSRRYNSLSEFKRANDIQ